MLKIGVGCEVYVSKKEPPGKGKSPLQVFNMGVPFAKVQMDVLGPLPISISGNRNIYLFLKTVLLNGWKPFL